MKLFFPFSIDIADNHFKDKTSQMGKVKRTSAEIIEIAKLDNLINIDQFHC